MQDEIIEYTQMYPTGESLKKGNCCELLSDIVMYLPLQKIPPLNILNLYLSKGCVGGGMEGGVRWSPFELDNSDYEKFLTSKSIYQSKMRISIDDEDAWKAWCYYDAAGVPFDEHLSLIRKLNELNELLDEISESDSRYQSEVKKINSWYLEYRDFMKPFRSILKKI